MEKTVGIYVCIYRNIHTAPTNKDSTPHPVHTYVHPHLHPMLLTRLTAYIQTLARLYVGVSERAEPNDRHTKYSRTVKNKVWAAATGRGTSGTGRQREKSEASEGKTTKRMLVNNDDGTSVLCVCMYSVRMYHCVCILHSKISCIKIVCSCICMYTVQGKSCHRCLSVRCCCCCFCCAVVAAFAVLCC